jgi:hypothetical protein
MAGDYDVYLGGNCGLVRRRVSYTLPFFELPLSMRACPSDWLHWRDVGVGGFFKMCIAVVPESLH